MIDQATKPLDKERTKINQQEFLSNVPTDSSAGREGLGEMIGDSWLRLDAKSLDPQVISKDPSDANSCT